MSTELRCYVGVSEVNSGVPRSIDIAPLHDPVKAITIAGDFEKLGEVTIAAGAVASLWTYLEHATFEILKLVIQGGHGALHLAWEVDKPVSASNLAKSGTCHRSCNSEMSCFDAWTLTTDECLVNPVLANASGFDGSGVPLIFSDGATVDGRLYGFWAKNPGTDPVVVAVYIRN